MTFFNLRPCFFLTATIHGGATTVSKIFNLWRPPLAPKADLDSRSSPLTPSGRTSLALPPRPAQPPLHLPHRSPLVLHQAPAPAEMRRPPAHAAWGHPRARPTSWNASRIRSAGEPGNRWLWEDPWMAAATRRGRWRGARWQRKTG
jgi:hypothetical protein